MACMCGDSECSSCGPQQGTLIYTGGYAEECAVCRTPLLPDEEERGTCDGCAAKRTYHDRYDDGNDGIEEDER